MKIKIEREPKAARCEEIRAFYTNYKLSSELTDFSFQIHAVRSVSSILFLSLDFHIRSVLWNLFLPLSIIKNVPRYCTWDEKGLQSEGNVVMFLKLG
jgi:hypothetical protein